MTKWHVHSPALDERENDFTASFTCTNGETGKVVRVTITQERGNPAADLIGGLRATAELLRQAASDELATAKLN